MDAVEAGRRVSGTVRFALRVADSEATARRLAEAGAVPVAPPVLTPWGDRNARVEAPDGMQLTLFTPGEPLPWGGPSREAPAEKLFTRSGITRTITRATSSGSGGGSSPRYFCDSSLGSHLPGSPVTSAVPRISADWYGLAVSNTVRLTRGSRARLSTLRRVAIAENSTVSPSRRIHTTEAWGPPSGFSVATVAKFLPSRSLRATSSRATATGPSPLYVASPAAENRPGRPDLPGPA